MFSNWPAPPPLILDDVSRFKDATRLSFNPGSSYNGTDYVLETADGMSFIDPCIDLLKTTAKATQAGCLLYYYVYAGPAPHSMAGILPAGVVAVFVVLFST